MFGQAIQVGLFPLFLQIAPAPGYSALGRGGFLNKEDKW